MIIDSNQHIHVVWQDDISGNYEIYYKKSTDGGNTWTAPSRLVWNSGFSLSPFIAVDSSNNIFLVWQDDSSGNAEVYFKKSTNSGASWSGTSRMTWNSGDSKNPMIAVAAANTLYSFWWDDTPGNGEIYFKKSTNSGISWGSLNRMTWNSGHSMIPIAVVDSNGWIHLLWTDYTSGNGEVYYKKSTNGGTAWGPTQRLTWNSGESWLNDVSVDSANNIHIVWDDASPGNTEIYYKRSTTGGDSWGPSGRLTWNSGESYSPSVYADPTNGIHVVWHDFSSGNFEVYYKKGSNSGASWGPLSRMTWNSGYSLSPRINGVNSSNLRLLWQDSTPGNYEIFFKKTSQVQPTITRFTNNTSYPIVSLVIDGYEQFPSSPQGIISGGYVEYAMTVGNHTFSAYNGFWNNSSRFTMYYFYGSFNQASGVTQYVTFNDPTINQLLTNFSSSATWTGEYWTYNPVTYHYASFTFYSNGTYNFYVDGSFKTSGSYTLVQRLPATYRVIFTVGGGINGDLYETEGFFYMQNGPTDWPTIQYVRQ